MMRRHLYIVLLVLTAVILCGCRPKGVLRSSQMREVLVDLHKTDALLQMTDKNYVPQEEKAVYYAQVLEKHGITQAQFDSSLVWYTAHPQLFDKIYPKVLAELKDEETRFLEENGLTLAASEEPISAPSAMPVFDRSDLDSVLWVTRNGMPTYWHPLVHDLEDQLFPQIGVLR